MHSIQRILAAAALLVAMSPAAHALDLFTPSTTAENGSNLTCEIISVGTKPIEVSLTIQSFWDGTDITSGTSCTGTPQLAPGAGCYAITRGVGEHSGYCHITTTSSRVRAALFVRDLSTGGLTSALAATK
jgi:hypothetical protein